MVAGVDEHYKEGFDYSSSLGDWSVGGLNKQLQNSVGGVIRNALFFPDPLNKFSPAHVEECLNVMNPEIADPHHYPRKKETLELFTREEKAIEFTHEDKTYLAKVHVFTTNFENATETHTCVRIGGSDEALALTSIRLMPFLTAFSDHADQTKNLRLIQLSLFDIDHKEGDKFSVWKPPTFNSVSQVVFALMDELRNQGYSIDSMMCHSMGSASLDDLDQHHPTKVPNTLILDRALPSVWKVGGQLLNPVSYYIIYALAYFSKWTGDPEESLMRFFTKMKNDPEHSKSLADRKVVIIETTEDFYFSGYGAFDRNLAKTLNELGVSAFQYQFPLNPIRVHPRAHHALPTDLLANNTDEVIGEEVFPIKPRQNVSSAIVQNVFLSKAKAS
jgi:hypothetical protein